MSAESASFVLAAREFAQLSLGHDFARFRHSIGVARRAQEVEFTVDPGDADVLLAAAWLHDIGYAEEALDTGFHPLDGARHLERHGWPTRVCALVAFHSGAYLVAEVIGLATQLRQFREERGPVADALTYADQTVGPFGERRTVEDRMADMLRRHGPDSPNARAHAVRGPYLRDVVDRVERRAAQRV